MAFSDLVSLSKKTHPLYNKIAKDGSLTSAAASLRKNMESKAKEKAKAEEKVRQEHAKSNEDGGNSFLSKVRNYQQSFSRAGNSANNRQQSFDVNSPMFQRLASNLAMKDAISSQRNNESKLKESQNTPKKGLSVEEFADQNLKSASFVNEKFASELVKHANTISRIRRIVRNLESKNWVLPYSSDKGGI